MTERPLVYLTPNCTPLFNKVVQGFKPCAVGQPYCTVQKKMKKNLYIKKKVYICNVNLNY